MWYRMFRELARLMLHLFFREFEVEGREHVPARGPVLFVPNHTNALVDPLVLLITLRRRVTLTAKNVLGKNPLLGLLMSGLGVVTFHRREDAGKGADPRQNVRSLQRCREILATGGAVCIFPEGVSHSDPKLRPFHPGPARIALDFLKKDGNPGGLQIVPAGLLYTEKDQFRSGVWLRYGPPIDVAHWLAQHPDGSAHDLTAAITRRVQDLTVNYEDRREALVLTWAAEIISTGGGMPPPLGRDDRSVAEWFRLLARLQTGYRTLLADHRSEMADLSSRVRQYRSELKRRGLAPGEVYLPMRFGKALLFVVRELELLLVGLPLALFGIVNHLVPYVIVKRVARALSTDKDHWASNVVYPSFLIFPVFYVIQLAAAWLFFPALWAGLYTVALPYTGYFALLYVERAGQALRRTRTFLHFLVHRADQERFAREGQAILSQVRTLEALLPTASPPTGEGETPGSQMSAIIHSAPAGAAESQSP